MRESICCSPQWPVRPKPCQRPQGGRRSHGSRSQPLPEASALPGGGWGWWAILGPDWLAGPSLAPPDRLWLLGLPACPGGRPEVTGGVIGRLRFFYSVSGGGEAAPGCTTRGGTTARWERGAVFCVSIDSIGI